MSILVTGGAGYVGSHVVLELMNLGLEVVILDDLSVGRKSSLADNVTLYIGDIGDTGLVERIILAHDVKTIIHMAAITSIPCSIEYPDQTYLTNTVKSQALLEAALKMGIYRFVFSSVAAVYGEPKTSRVSEDHPLAPHTPYGDSKASFEAILADTAKKHKNFSYAILRCFNIAGVDKEQRVPQWPDSATHLVKLAAMAGLGYINSIQINGTDYNTRDGTCIRDYIHVTDAARGHVLAYQELQKGSSPFTVNLGSGVGTSVREVIDIAKRLGGHDFEIIEGNKREGDPETLVACTKLAEKKLKWKPEHSTIEDIVRSAIEWEKACAEHGSHSQYDALGIP